MRKERAYQDVRFDAKAISEADKFLRSLAPSKIDYSSLTVRVTDEEKWEFDKMEEFLVAVEQAQYYFYIAYYYCEIGKEKREIRLTISMSSEGTEVSVGAPDRDGIEELLSVFDKNLERCRAPYVGESSKHTKVFIGHGRNQQWRDLKDHLHEKHGYAVEAYEIGSREGHAVRDILEQMLEGSSFALLVMTGEDETKDGKMHPRLNVVHETGLFQGRLGFGRAVVLLEDGTEDFSNISGIQQVRFAKGRIRETFGDVVAVLKRELG